MRDRFAKAVARLEAEAEQCEAGARAAATAGRREAALRALRARKVKLSQAAVARSKADELEAAATAIASEVQSAAFIAAVREGTAALQALQAALPVDAVTRVLEDTADALAAAQELDDAIASSSAQLVQTAGSLAMASDADLMEELERLDAATREVPAGRRGAATSSTLVAAPAVAARVPSDKGDFASALPAVPTHVVTAPTAAVATTNTAPMELVPA